MWPYICHTEEPPGYFAGECCALELMCFRERWGEGVTEGVRTDGDGGRQKGRSQIVRKRGGERARERVRKI